MDLLPITDEQWDLDHSFEIFVKTFGGKMLTVKVTKGSTVMDVKKWIEAMVGIPPHHQRLIFAGKQVEDDKTMVYYNIQRETTLLLVQSMVGC